MKERSADEIYAEVVKVGLENDAKRIEELEKKIEHYGNRLKRNLDKIDKNRAMIKTLDREKTSLQMNEIDIFVALDRLVEIENEKNALDTKIELSRDSIERTLKRIAAVREMIVQIQNEMVEFEKTITKSVDMSVSITKQDDDPSEKLRKIVEGMQAEQTESMGQERKELQNFDSENQVDDLLDQMDNPSEQQDIEAKQKRIDKINDMFMFAFGNTLPEPQLKNLHEAIRLHEEIEAEKKSSAPLGTDNQSKNTFSEMETANAAGQLKREEEKSSVTQKPTKVVSADPEVIEGKRKELEGYYAKMVKLYSRLTGHNSAPGDTFQEFLRLKATIRIEQSKLAQLGEQDRGKIDKDSNKVRLAQEFQDQIQLMMLKRDKALFDQEAKSLLEKESAGKFISLNESSSLRRKYNEYFSNMMSLGERFMFQTFPDNLMDMFIDAMGLEERPSDPEELVRKSLKEASALTRDLSENFFVALDSIPEDVKIPDEFKSQKPDLEKIGTEVESIKEKISATSNINDLKALREELGRCRDQLDNLLSSNQHPGELLNQLFDDVNDLLVQVHDQEQALLLKSDIINSATRETIAGRIEKINTPEVLEALREELKGQQEADTFDQDIDSADSKVGHNDLHDAVRAIDKKLDEIKTSLKTSEHSIADNKQHRVP